VIFLIDVGNSRTKYVQFDNKTLSTVTQLNNDHFTADYFSHYFSKAKQVVMANVGHLVLTQRLANWCQDQGVCFTEVQSEQRKNTLISAYQEPTTLGIDRWLALLGAINLYPQKRVLIIDAGTATTVDLLASDGQHQGGWILSGIEALFDTIIQKSTLVHANKSTMPNVAFGKSTTDNVNNACWAATLGMIEQAIKQAQQLGEIEHIIFTGGNGQALKDLLLENNKHSNELGYKVEHNEKLIFLGLKSYC
jgi:type III pantothenate kinase